MHRPKDNLMWILVVVAALAACTGSEQSSQGGDGSSDAANKPLAEAVCDLLTPEEVERFASGPDVNSEGVYDNYLKPVADLCRYEGAFTLQLDYGTMGKAELATYLKTGTPGVEVVSIAPSGFEGAVQQLLPDSDLGTTGTVLDVTLQVADRVLILDPDGLIESGSPESEVLQELAGIAASRL